MNSRNRSFSVVVGFLALCLGGCVAPASHESPSVPDTQRTPPQAVITKISTDVRGEAVHIVVHGTAPLQYTASQLHDPPRIAVEIPEALLGDLPQPLPGAVGIVQRIEALPLPEERKVRLLLHLSRTAMYTVEAHGPQVAVILTENISVGASMAGPTRAATVPEAGPAKTMVTEVTSETLPDKIVVNIQTLGDLPQVRVKQHQDPPQLLLDIEHASLATEQAEHIPVPAAGGILSHLTAVQMRAEGRPAVRIVAHLQTSTPFEVRQDDHLVRLIMAPPALAAPAAGAGPLVRKPTVVGQAAPFSPASHLMPPARTAAASPLRTARPRQGLGGTSSAPLTLLAAAPGSNTAAATPGAGSVEAQGPRYVGEKISLDFQNADINDILRLIAEVSGLNIIAGGDVQGTVTTRMVDVPWDQALEVILKINGLAQERDGNIIRVAPIGRFINERQETLRARQTENQAEPTVTQLVSINYANAGELKGNLEKLLSPRGSIYIDARTNTMIVTDTKKNLDEILELVDTLDRQTPQVMIEARIVEASRNFTRELGVRFGGQYTAVTDRTFPNRVSVSGRASDTAPGNFLVDLPAAVDVGSGGAIGFALAGASSLLNIELSALERSGQGKTISNPRIATLDNTEAQIQSGVRIPFVTTSAEGTKTELVDASLILKVTPHVTPDGFISLKINVTNNQPNPQLTSGGQPSISTREANTAMLVRDADTVVIGGLYRREFSSSRDGVPGLSQVPLLGWLFRNTEEIDRNEELLIFITPRIIRQPEESRKGRTARAY